MTLPASPELTDEVLEPCPFCGGPATIERQGTMLCSMIIACENCGARVESGDVYGMTQPANYRWNRRHRSSPSAEWPDFIAPPKYENAAPGWEDPHLPDFRLIWQTARECGYAVGLHGSMKRDVDLIAAPWTDSAAPIETLISSLCAVLDVREVGIREAKPQGRVSLNLQINGWFKIIDLSIMPPLPEPPK